MDQELKNLIQSLITTIQAKEQAQEQREKQKARNITGQPAASARLSAQIDRDVDSTEQLARLEERRNGILTAIAAQKREAVAAASNEKSVAGQMVATEQASLTAQRQKVSVYRDELSILRQTLKERSKSNNLTDTERQKLNSLIALAQRNLETSERDAAAMAQKVENAQRLVPVLSTLQARSADLVTVMTQGIYAAGASDRSFFGAMFGTGTGGNFISKVKAMGKGLDLANGFTNLAVGSATSLVSALFNLATQQDKAAVTFGRATGASSEYNNSIMSTVERNHRLYVSFDESAEAFATLYNQMNSFSTLTRSTRNQIADFTIVQQRLGVSFETSAATLNKLTKTFGMSTDQAISYQRRISVFARQIGVSEQVALNNFVQFADTLASRGPAMERVFKGLQEQAKRSGVAMGELIGFASQFDTFQGAADVVGKLNALLGGNYLNVLGLVNAKEHERVQLVAQAVGQSGRLIDSMGHYTKIAITNALRVKDVGTAMKMLRANLGQLTQAEIRDAEAKKANQERAEGLLKISDKLRTIFLQIGHALLPYIQRLLDNKDAIIQVVHRVTDFIKTHGEMIAKIMVLTPLISGAAQIMTSFGVAMLAATGRARGLVGVLGAGVGGGLVYLIYKLSGALFGSGDSGSGTSLPQQMNSVSSGMNTMSTAARNLSSPLKEAAGDMAAFTNMSGRMAQISDSLDTGKIVAAANAYGSLKNSMRATAAEAKGMQATAVSFERTTAAAVQLEKHPNATAAVGAFNDSIQGFKQVQAATNVHQNTQVVAQFSAEMQRAFDNMNFDIRIDNKFDKHQVSTGLASLRGADRKTRGSIYGVS